MAQQSTPPTAISGAHVADEGIPHTRAPPLHGSTHMSLSYPPPLPPPPALVDRRRVRPGILRLDINKPRRSSGGSVEFRSQPQMLGEDVTSPPSSSPHQLSVTWATPPCDNGEPDWKHKSPPTYLDYADESITQQREKRSSSQEERPSEVTCNLTSPVDVIDSPWQGQLNDYFGGNVNYNSTKRHSSNEDYHDTSNKDNDDEEDDDEEYSVSVSAIIQRRASVRGYRGKRGSRSSRRASSPMDHLIDTVERRRSSVYTSSSDEGTNQESTQEQIYENIRLHKEVIQSVKLQPWPMRKKLKLVRQAKTYVARHEGALQERFAMSRSTKDLWARFKILMAARWLHWKRETASFLTVLIPWELRIKEIESHFGSGVASYFTFLRWLMWVNIMMAIPLVAFVIGPEYFATKKDETDPRKRMTEHEYKVAGNFFTFWEFEGYLKYSPMFYGYYSSSSGASSLGYKLPLAYFLTAVVVYIYSFVATLRKMAENSRNSKLSSKDDECTFSWKLFTGWDFMIGHAETAHNRIASVVVGFKEALLEEAEKKKDNRNWRIILQRILVNLLVMGLLAASGYTVVALVNNSEKLARQDNWLSRNAVNITMTLLSFFLPMIFEALGLFEKWHPRQQLRLQLARIMILNMLNLYSLMFSFIYNINSKEQPLQKLKERNDTATFQLAQLTTLIEGLRNAANTSTSASTLQASTSTLSLTDSTTESVITSTATTLLYTLTNRLRCYNITVKCSKPTRVNNRNLATLTTLLLINLTTPTVPYTTTEPSTFTQWTTSATSPTTFTEIETTTEEPFTTLQWTTTAQRFLSTQLPPAAIKNYSDTTSRATETTKTTTTTAATTTEALETSTAQSSTTSTPAPGNDSFFDYMDYFVGMSLELSDSNNDDGDEGSGATQTTQTTHRSTKRRTTNRARPTRIGRNQRTANRKPRQVTVSVPTTSTQQSMQRSRYSRRRNESTTLRTLVTDDADYDISSSSSTVATTTTMAHKPSTRNTSTSPILLTTKTATSATSTTSASTNTIDTQSDTPSSAQNESFPSLHVNDAKLQEVLAYFTSSTTTIEPPTTKTTRATTTTFATTETTTTQRYDDNTTPYFIDESEIEDISPDITYYDLNEIDEENFEYCVRTICEEVPGDSTTELDVTATPPMPTLTPLEAYQNKLVRVKQKLHEVQRNLTSMCWETSLGQELSKVIVFDGLMSLVAPLCIDFLRALFVRYVNQHWCWDMEKTFPQYGDFKIAENILTLINNQGQVWMGIFFSPGLVLVNLVKLMIMMYFRSWIVLTCNVPHEVVFKASKSNNFYLALLLTMLFLCVLPVSYAIVWLRPSWHCGPFSDYNRISEFITNSTQNALPKELHGPLNYLTSASTVIPLLLLLILIIYYLVSLTGALREANQDLRTQLQKEREEERKKIFKVPEIKPVETNTATLTSRWRKVLEASSPVTPTQPPDFETEEYKNKARKELISRIMKEALRKGSATSEDDSINRHGRDDDDTDTEHHDSLPHDEEGKDKGLGLSKLQQIRRSRKPSLVDIVQIAKSEREREQRASMKASHEAHTKGRFRMDKLLDKRDKSKEAETVTDKGSANETKTNDKEKLNGAHNGREVKKDIGATHPSTDNDNDPETNSRIVNERRQSLLRKKSNGDAKPMDRKPTSKPTSQPTSPPINILEQQKKSNFELVDEKKPLSSEDRDLPPPKHRSFSVRGGTFKFRRQRKPITSPTEPEVFKFDEKSTDQTDGNGDKLAKPIETRALSPARFTDGLTTPTFIPALYRQANPEKLVNLSRQGRKKIGTLFALMREAVNAKLNEEQNSPTGSGEPGTPNVTTSPTSCAPMTPIAATPPTATSTAPTPTSAASIATATTTPSVAAKTTALPASVSPTAAASTSLSPTTASPTATGPTAASPTATGPTAGTPKALGPSIATPAVAGSKAITPKAVTPTAALRPTSAGPTVVTTTSVMPTASTSTTATPKAVTSAAARQADTAAITPSTTGSKPATIEIPSSVEAKSKTAAAQLCPKKSAPGTFSPKPRTKRAPLESAEELEQPISVAGTQPSIPAQARKPLQRSQATRQDSQSTMRPENIPTITVSKPGSDECIVKTIKEERSSSVTTITSQTSPPKEIIIAPKATKSASSSPESKVKVIKIKIEDEK